MSSLTATAHSDIGAADIVLNINTVTDTFTRSTSNGWGTADTGQAWTTSGGAAGDYSTNGTKAIQSVNTTATFRHATITVGATDMRARATLNIDTGAVATAAATGVVAARLTDTSNYYVAQLSFNTDDTVTLFIGKRVAGSFTALSGSVTIVTGYVANQQITVDLEVVGSTIRAKAWATTTSSEPTSWLVSATDTSLTTGTSAGLLSRLESGNTNGTVQFQWDNLTVDEAGQPWHVSRVYPDGTSAELLGSPVYTSGGYAVLWDTVLPLDALVFYRATNTLSTTILTSNTITVTGVGQGWLRDPAQPVNDILLTTCPTGVCPLDVDNDDTSVSFIRLGQAQFPSATGVFPIIDAARPRTVAQTRKARESSLGILSHTLAAEERVEDILASGRNLFLQLTSRFGWARRTWYGDYVTVGDVNEDRPPTPNMTYPHRAWALPFALARPPWVPTELTGGNGVGVSGATYGDGTASNRTYAERAAAGPQLVGNAEFETNVSGWSANTGATIAHSTAQAKFGTGSMLITPDGVTATTGVTQTQAAAVPATAGATYLLAGWIYSAAGSSDVRMAVDWYQSNGTSFISSGLPSAISATAGVWTFFTATLTAPALTGFGRLRVRLGSTPTGLFYADHCVMYLAGGTYLTSARGAGL